MYFDYDSEKTDYRRSDINNLFNLKDDTIIYIGSTEGIKPDKFKEMYRGRTPKNGFYMIIKDLIRSHQTDRNEYEVSGLLKRFSIRTTNIKYLNTNYYGMQFVKDYLKDEWYYVFILRENRINIFSYINKGHVSFNVIEQILKYNNYKKIYRFHDPLNKTKIVYIWINKKNNTMLSLKTDGRLYNLINIIRIVDDDYGDYKLECTDRTSLITSKYCRFKYQENPIDDFVLSKYDIRYRDQEVKEVYLYLLMLNEQAQFFINVDNFVLGTLRNIVESLDNNNCDRYYYYE